VLQPTRSLAIAYAPDRIRVDPVAPSRIGPPLTTALQREQARDCAILECTPMKRWSEPEDLAGPMVFRCTHAATFMIDTFRAHYERIRAGRGLRGSVHPHSRVVSQH
jgi:NAD(P)-dependent dehydrogenase (short-subunit alcohol dehydrogenase family)